MFAALCWLNCLAIEDWEQHRHGGRIRWLSGIAIAAGCIILPYLANHPARWLAVTAVLSASLFLLLDRSRLAVGGLRIAADLALLTPLLIFCYR